MRQHRQRQHARQHGKDYDGCLRPTLVNSIPGFSGGGLKATMVPCKIRRPYLIYFAARFGWRVRCTIVRPKKKKTNTWPKVQRSNINKHKYGQDKRQKKVMGGVGFRTVKVLANVLGMDIPAAWQSKSANNHATMVKLTNVVTGVSKAAYVPGTIDDVVTKLFSDFVN